MDVQRLAELASLELTPEEVEQYRTQLQRVIDYMQQIDSVDVSGVAMMDTCMQEGVRLREDILGRQLDREDALSTARESHRGYYVVPRII
jgi:aspartyl-tRNA(Asn)/glutamyl-tRNA(Gln) amidotransferase subunit C